MDVRTLEDVCPCACGCITWWAIELAVRDAMLLSENTI